MTTGLSVSPTTEIWPKVWEIRGAVAADAENPMARVAVSISMLLVRRIAEDLKLSRRTVQRALTDLERHGFLERTLSLIHIWKAPLLRRPCVFGRMIFAGPRRITTRDISPMCI